MTLTNLFQIDGKSLYAPDCDIEPSYSDLDSSDSGRDEAGYMHREVVREKVATWPIAYSCLTDDEYKYTIGLFAGKATFQFTHPKAGSSTETETTTCYCSKYGIAWHNAKTKQWKNGLDRSQTLPHIPQWDLPQHTVRSYGIAAQFSTRARTRTP